MYVQPQAFDSVDRRELISNVAIQCRSLAMNFNSFSNSSFEGVVLPYNNEGITLF